MKRPSLGNVDQKLKRLEERKKYSAEMDDDRFMKIKKQKKKENPIKERLIYRV